jgi:N-acetyl sugar amidotransferase
MTSLVKGLPKQVVFCKKCVISNQRPNSTVEFFNTIENSKETIEFDEEGICSGCRFNSEKNQKIDWEERESQLSLLLAKYRRSDGTYDVVVPGSGGKDSAYTSHLLKYKYGMNPLTVTWAPHKYTDIGWKNFENWIHVGGLDNLLFTPNGKLHRYLTQQAFLNLLHPFQPFIIGQRMIGPKMAAKFGIQLVMYGENQAEYGNNISENKSAVMKEDFFTSSSPNSVFLGGKSVKQMINENNFTLNDFSAYLPMRFEDANKHDIKVHYLGYYKKWDPQECYYYAVENTGFEANSERTEGSYSKYSSIDDEIDMFHYYTTLIKFGIGRATYDASQEIRNEKITRDEAVNLVKRYDLEFPSKYFKSFLEYINITEELFHNTIDNFRSPHLWIEEHGQWKLRHAVWH